MIREVIIGGKSARLIVEGDRLRLDSDADAGFSIVPTSPGSFSILIDGRSYRGTLGAKGEVHVNGEAIGVEVFDPRDLRARKGTGSTEGRQEVKAPMPGKIVRVLVSQGDEIQAGDGLIVVEAMKMQNEIKSPKAGRVAELRAKADATVAAGEVLAVIE